MQRESLNVCPMSSEFLNPRPNNGQELEQQMTFLSGQIRGVVDEIWNDARGPKAKGPFRFKRGSGKSVTSLTGRIINYNQPPGNNKQGYKKCLSYQVQGRRYYQRSCRTFRKARVICKKGMYLTHIN